MKLIGYYNYTVIATYLAGICSVIGIFLAFNGDTKSAVILLMVAGAIDMFDGKIASTMKRTDEEKLFGVQIDSLCDMVSFGVLPVVIGKSIGIYGPLFYIISALYVITAVIRLSYFNVDETMRQRKAPQEDRKIYYGCPVTASALLFPMVYALAPMLDGYYYVAYLAVMLILSLAFVIKFSVSKPRLPGIIAILAIGCAVAYMVIA